MIVAIALIGAFIGGLKLSGGQKDAAQSRVAELEQQIASRDQTIADSEDEISNLTNSRNTIEKKVESLEAELGQKETEITKGRFDKLQHILHQCIWHDYCYVIGNEKLPTKFL